MEIQFIIAGFGFGAAMIGMLIKINRCVGRQEGKLCGLETLLHAHLNDLIKKD